LTPMNNQRENHVPDFGRDMGMNRIIEEGKVRREQNTSKLEKMMAEEEEKKRVVEMDRKEKEGQRQEERQQMKLDISIKRKSIRKDENAIEMEWFIPTAAKENSSPEESNREAFSSPKVKEDKMFARAPNSGVNIAKDERKVITEDENLIEILNEMQKIVEAADETKIEDQKTEENYSEDETKSTLGNIEDREDDSDDPKDVINTEFDISNVIHNQVQNFDTSNVSLKPLLEEELGAEKYKKIANLTSKIMNKYLTDINLPNANPYEELNKELGHFMNKDSLGNFLPLVLMQVMNFDGI